MQTQSLKDLKELKLPVKVASFKPYKDSRISTYCPCMLPENDPERIGKLIAKRYVNAVEWTRWRIEATLRPLYSRPLSFPDCSITDMVVKVKDLINSTGMNIPDIARQFRTYLGYPCQFFRNEGSRRVPVDSQRLLKAHQAMRNRALVGAVERILYS